eukprot:4076360-Amphidinium_carterae.4
MTTSPHWHQAFPVRLWLLTSGPVQPHLSRPLETGQDLSTQTRCVVSVRLGSHFDQCVAMRQQHLKFCARELVLLKGWNVWNPVLDFQIL